MLVASWEGSRGERAQAQKCNIGPAAQGAETLHPRRLSQSHGWPDHLDVGVPPQLWIVEWHLWPFQPTFLSNPDEYWSKKGSLNQSQEGHYLCAWEVLCVCALKKVYQLPRMAVHVTALWINAMGLLLCALKYEETFSDCHTDSKGFRQQDIFWWLLLDHRNAASITHCLVGSVLLPGSQ